MRAEHRVMLRLSNYAEAVDMTPDKVSKFMALAFMQAHIVADKLHEVVIPLLSPAKRSFAASIARRIERAAVVEETTLRELEALGNILDREIQRGTHVYWHGDESHVRGGYEVVYRDAEASELSSAATELALLKDFILASLAAARAARDVGSLIDS